MLGKLITYDFKALGRVLLPLQLGTLVAGILASVVMTLYFRWFNTKWESDYIDYGRNSVNSFDTVFSSMTTFVGFLLFVVVTASILVTLFLVARHFYMNFLGNEGYLTFTLPVTTTQHLAAKTISGTCWIVINALVVIVVMLTVLLFGFAYEGLVNTEILEGMVELLEDALSGPGLIVLLELPFFGLVSLVSSLLMIYLALSIGGVLASKYKILAAVVAYFCINALAGIFSTLLTTISFVVMESTGWSEALVSSDSFSSFLIAMQPVLVVSFASSLVLCVVFFVATHYILANKLNLE